MKYVTYGKRTMKEMLGFNFFDVAIYGYTILIALMAFYPLWYVFIGSIEPSGTKMMLRAFLYPVPGSNFDIYRAVMSTTWFVRSGTVSVLKSFIGSSTSVVITAMAAYPASKKHLFGMKALNYYLMITMFFSGGIVPYFILIKRLGLYDNFLVYIIPGLFGIGSYIYFRNFFSFAITKELEDSALIDGASEFNTFFLIVLPQALPILAVFFFFGIVGHWNDFTTWLMFTNSKVSLRPYIVVVQQIMQSINAIIFQAMPGQDVADIRNIPPTNLRMTILIISMLPILIIFPFIQTYFTKVQFVGAVKE